MDSNEKLRLMSLREKIDLCEGGDFWHTKGFKRHGIPRVMMCDGPHGLRKQASASDNLGINRSVAATCFPTSAASGCSWDPELCYKIGRAIGEEARANEVSLVLGPGLNIKRDPLCGRNFEYYSEDPYLSGKLASGFVRGVQSTGVGACLKHYAVNSQEYKRCSSDSVLDERTLREIYLKGFEIAVKESDPRAVMNSYNKVNGLHTGESPFLIRDILRGEWGFGGIVVTDWGAMNDRTESFRAGCDLNMPGGSGYQRRKVMKAVRLGHLSTDYVDACADRMLDFIESSERIKPAPCDMEAHHELARRAAEESAVLLKNGGALPLKGTACLIGHMAEQLRYQGVGSSHINPYKLSDPADCMDYPRTQGCNRDGSTTEALLEEAVMLAKSVDTPIVFAGLTDSYESEGFDRSHMKMPEGHVRMINAVSEANPNTVVVLTCGSPVEMPWADRVNAILYMALPGQAGGEAVKNLLTGRVNPSGKLTETWLMSYDDAVTGECFGKRDAEYREGVYVGYRYYDTAAVPVRYKFGHGLSYTEFEYSDLKTEGKKVYITIKNTGKVSGAEVVQLYILPPQSSVYRPARELKAFRKISLRPGESKTEAFELDDSCFSVWHGGWRTPKGIYTVGIGGLKAEVFVDGEDIPVPEWQKGTWYEKPSGKPPRSDWLKLLGRDFVSKEPEKGSFDMDCSVSDMMNDSKLMRMMYKLIERVISLAFSGRADYDDPSFKMMMSCSADVPLRNLCITAKLPEGFFLRLLKLANKRK